MLVKTRAIFLSYIKYSDSSVIAHVYTEDFGRQSYIVSGLHGRKSSTRINLFQPLFLLELEVYNKANSNSLQRMKQATVASPLISLPFDVIKSTQAIFISEVLQTVLREEEENQSLFDFLFSAIAILDAVEDGKANFLLNFLLKFSRYLGIPPKRPASAQQKYFDISIGSFVENEPIHHAFLDADLSAAFAQLFSLDLSSVDKLKYTNKQRRELLDALILYYRMHLELASEFKSLTIMRELMD